MRLHLEGSNSIGSTSGSAYALLTDPSFIAKTLPDAEEAKVTGPSSLEGIVRVKVAIVSSRLRVKMSIIPVQPPTKASMKVSASGSGSNMDITSEFELAGDSPTTMKWSADAEITGVIAGMGSGILKGFATKKIEEIFQGITKAIEAAST